MEQYACSPEYVQKDTFESSFPSCGKNRPTKKRYPTMFKLPRIVASYGKFTLYTNICIYDLYVIHNYIHISYHICYICGICAIIQYVILYISIFPIKFGALNPRRSDLFQRSWRLLAPWICQDMLRRTIFGRWARSVGDESPGFVCCVLLLHTETRVLCCFFVTFFPFF